jgi:hypothetical protein
MESQSEVCGGCPYIMGVGGESDLPGSGGTEKGIPVEPYPVIKTCYAKGTVK